MKTMCSNYSSGKCKRSKRKKVPTGMDKATGFCNVWQKEEQGDWLLKGNEDCNSLDLEGRPDHE